MKFTIDETNEGTRLDILLPKLNPTISRSHGKKLIKLGSVLVNKKSTKAAYIPQIGDIIEIVDSTDVKKSLVPIDKPLTIIFENNDFCVVDKPAGLTVHPSDSSNEETLVNYLLFHYPEIQTVGEDPCRPGIVHRLDKLTSGVMVVAKNQKMFDALKEAWQNGLVQKEYIALVWGDIEHAGSVAGKITRSKRTGRMVARRDEGREAITLFSPLEHYTNATLVAVATHTGRTHQIRTHFKSLGQPVVGDPIYHYKKHKQDFPRLYLHAHKLTFPYEGERRTFTSEPPKSFTSYLESLKKKS